MKKKLLYIVLALVSMLFLVACSGDDNGESEDAGSGDKPIVLKAGTNLPTKHMMMEGLINPLLEKIEEDSGGRVKFEVYDSETLVRAGEELEALRSGTIDIAVPLYDVYDPARFPFAELPLLPVTSATQEVFSKAMSILNQDDEPYSDGKTHAERLYGDQDLVAWPYTTGRSYTIATNGEPIKSLAELQALQIRIPSTVHEIFANNLGASPVRISANEAYDAFSRGALDAGFTPIVDWDSYGLDEVFTYIIDGIDAGSWPSSIAMTKEKFESLPEDIQEIFDNAITELTNLENNPDLAKANTQLEEEILSRFYDKGGIMESLSDLPQDIQDKVDEAITQTWFDWIDALEAEGHPAKEAAIKWRDAIIEAGGDVPDAVKELSVD